MSHWSGMLGTSVGNYEVTSRLGMGGMGAVYLARHTMLGRPAAVKVLRPELSNNRDLVQRFFNEARAATAIRHPGIVEIYDFGILPSGDAYIIMEFLEGESLGARLKRVERMPSSQALVLVRQIAGALHAAHQQKIVHRDLKPDNIFLVRDPEISGGERIKLLDFGIAKLGANVGASSGTLTGELIGTPAYMAPEQCRGAGDVDGRADLYALGCIFYDLLCGRPPFLADGAGDFIAHHLYFAPDPPSLHEPSLPVAVDQLVMWLLKKDPLDRPATAADLIAALDQLSAVPPGGDFAFAARDSATQRPGTTDPTTLSGLGSHSTIPEARSAVSAGPRLRWGIFVGAGGVLLLGGGLLWMGGDDRREPRPPLPATATNETAAPEVAPSPPPPPPELPALEPPVISSTPDTISVAVDSEPSGAEIWFNGKEIGSTPFVAQEPSGSADRSYIVRKDGFAEEEVTFAGDVGGTQRVKLRKKPGPNKGPRPKRPDKDRGINPFD
jgi:eukaryotic-like serine/threonine-protein kinase